MKNKPDFRKLGILLVLIFVANPVLATAGDLFLSSTQAKQTLLSSELSDSKMPCHQNNDLEPKQVAKGQFQEECCADVCLCDDSSCQGFSLLFQATSTAFYLSNLKTQFYIPLYQSLSSAPKSPPPII